MKKQVGKWVSEKVRRILLTYILSHSLTHLLTGCTSPHDPTLTPAARACVANLREMQAIKLQWAAEHHKTAADQITMQDLMDRDRYLLTRFECPSGGSYSWGKVGEKAECTIAAHTLP